METNLRLDTSSMQPLRDDVYKTLRDAILKGELAPGTRLMEIHLSNSLGVSRTPVREAIRMLESEGLAVTYPRKGARVARMTIKDLEDVLDVRKALDVLAVKEACKNSDDATIAELEGEMHKFESAVVSEDTRAIVESDESFHSIIYRAADNPKLMEIIKSLREQMYRYRYEYVKEKTILDSLILEHKKILEGIKNRDKDLVQKIMEEHLDNQYISVRDQIRQQEENR